MLTAVSVAQECGFISPDQQIILITAHEVDGQSHVEFHTSTRTDNQIGPKDQAKPLLDFNGVCIVILLIVGAGGGGWIIQLTNTQFIQS